MVLKFNLLVGRKAVNYYKFRNREIAGSWTGFSDNPTYENAKEVADALIEAFLADAQLIKLASMKFTSSLLSSNQC